MTPICFNAYLVNNAWNENYTFVRQFLPPTEPTPYYTSDGANCYLLSTFIYPSESVLSSQGHLNILGPIGFWKTSLKERCSDQRGLGRPRLLYLSSSVY
jgi:hypothetical protein